MRATNRAPRAVLPLFGVSLVVLAGIEFLTWSKGDGVFALSITLKSPDQAVLSRVGYSFAPSEEAARAMIDNFAFWQGDFQEVPLLDGHNVAVRMPFSVEGSWLHRWRYTQYERIVLHLEYEDGTESLQIVAVPAANSHPAQPRSVHVTAHKPSTPIAKG